MSDFDELIEQAQRNIADAPAAKAGQRCLAPPMGCGREIPSLATGFRDQKSWDEYQITGLCQSCQDFVFAPDEVEVMEMGLDPENYGRCGDCGEYRPYEFVDVGVGVMKGFDCCNPWGREARPPRCQKTPGCYFAADHFHGCEAPDLDIPETTEVA